MSKTKERILQAALQLFNTYGLSDITLRRIAAHLNISQGNLNYHYPKRGDIVYALYLRLFEELEAQLADMRSGENLGFGLLFEVTTKAFQALNKYKFLMLDFVQVMRRYPNVKKHYQGMIERRDAEFGMILQALVALGWMQPEDYENQYHNLTMQMSILGDSMFASFETIYNLPSEERPRKYIDLMTQMLYPNLTTKGKELYWEAYNKLYPKEI